MTANVPTSGGGRVQAPAKARPIRGGSSSSWSAPGRRPPTRHGAHCILRLMGALMGANAARDDAEALWWHEPEWAGQEGPLPPSEAGESIDPGARARWGPRPGAASALKLNSALKRSPLRVDRRSVRQRGRKMVTRTRGSLRDSETRATRAGAIVLVLPRSRETERTLIQPSVGFRSPGRARE